MKSIDLRISKFYDAPYTFCLVYEKDSKTWTGIVNEFPGCIAQGDTARECVANLYKAGESWIKAALDLGQDIPEPTGDRGFWK
jgi:antitoxin HicB